LAQKKAVVGAAVGAISSRQMGQASGAAANAFSQLLAAACCSAPAVPP
jgi:hypothetical protein